MESELFRTMPHNTLAEQSVLGAMLIEPGCIPKVITAIKGEDFYSDTNRIIYEKICDMFNRGEGIDPVTVANAVKGDIRDSDKYLIEVVSVVPTAANIGQYLKLVRDSAVLRSVITMADEILEDADKSVDGEDILDAAERTIQNLRSRKDSGLRKVSESLSGVYNEIAEQSKGNGLPGISTGLFELDEAISGLNKGELILLASRPGMGKTSLAMNIALYAAKRGNPTAVFSLEMSTEQLIRRLLAGEAYIDSSKLKTGKLEKEEWSKLSSAVASISKAELYIDDNSMATVSDMNAQCRKIKNLGLVVIDYLQLMSSASGTAYENRQQTVSEISRMLKIMAKELNVPVLCLSQLSRDSAKRSDKRPNLSDLRESGSLEQDADVVLGIYRKDYFDRDSDTGEAELLIMKNRNGMVGAIPLVWLPQYTTYTSAARTE